MVNWHRSKVVRVCREEIEKAMTQVQENAIAALPEPGHLLTLTEAAGEFGIALPTLSHWLKVGRLTERERQTNKQGSPVRVDRRDVAALAAGYRPHRDRKQVPVPT